MRRRTLAVVAASALLAACVSVSLGTADTPGLTYFELADARPAAFAATPPKATARLAIQSGSSDPLSDSTAIVYSRRSGERALYQLAAWTERPSRRLALLAQQRLEARGRFATVSQLGQPIATDWLLTLSVETLVHDVGSEPGRAQLALRADLIHRQDRSRVAQRVFSAAPPVAEASAPAAVAAFGVATADVLDRLAEWVEATVAAQPKR